MQGTTTYSGRLVAINSREYSFADRQTGEKIEGVSHRLFLLTDDKSEPMLEFKVHQDNVGKFLDFQGKSVAVVAEPRAQNNRVVWHAVGVNGTQ